MINQVIRRNYFWAPRWGFALGLLLATGCFRDTRVTVELQVPALASASCAQRVEAAFSTFDRDIVRIESLHPETRTLVVNYDSEKIALRNIQHHLAEAGFDCDDIPGYPAAKAQLPEDCR
ncbi:MAG: heavy-metal-associated domain-containing protein [Kiritimatiellia bacterium]|nr:heavy-metal-associated domain-containing protein [Kiritimatiellia bacterium]